MKNYGWKRLTYTRFGRCFSLGVVLNGWYIAFYRGMNSGRLRFTITANYWRKYKVDIKDRNLS